MPLTKEQLLIPRVMCTGEEKGKRLYPHSDVSVGDILTLDPLGHVYASDLGKWVGKAQVAEFRHLFRPMPWWEGRKLEDMPEYVRIKSKILKVVKYRINDGEFVPEGKKIIKTLNGTTPATREEYEEFLKQKEE